MLSFSPGLARCAPFYSTAISHSFRLCSWKPKRSCSNIHVRWHSNGKLLPFDRLCSRFPFLQDNANISDPSTTINSQFSKWEGLSSLDEFELDKILKPYEKNQAINLFTDSSNHQQSIVKDATDLWWENTQSYDRYPRPSHPRMPLTALTNQVMLEIMKPYFQDGMIVYEGGAANLQLAIDTHFYAWEKAQKKLRGIVATDINLRVINKGFAVIQHLNLKNNIVASSASVLQLPLIYGSRSPKMLVYKNILSILNKKGLSNFLSCIAKTLDDKSLAMFSYYVARGSYFEKFQKNLVGDFKRDNDMSVWRFTCTNPPHIGFLRTFYSAEQIWAKFTEANLQVIESDSKEVRETLQQGLIGHNRCVVVAKKV